MAFFDDIGALPSDGDNIYYIDHYDKDFEVFKTFQPENCSGTLNIREPHDITYDVSFSAKDVHGAFIISGHDTIRPKRTGWFLRQGHTPIAAGWHTSINTKAGNDYCRVGGKSWLDYLNFDSLPYDPRPDVPDDVTGYMTDCTFGPSATHDGNNPPQGLMYQEVSRKLTLVLKDILMQVFVDGPAIGNRPPIAVSAMPALGPTIHFAISNFDDTSICDWAKKLSDIGDGFDFEVDWKLRFLVWSPFRYGTNDISDDRDDPRLIFTFDESNRQGVDIEFTNTGPEATRVVGSGVTHGGTPRTRTSEYLAASAEFYRMSKKFEFDTDLNPDNLYRRIVKQLAFSTQPVHEIPLSCYPESMELEGVNFWELFHPGEAIWIAYDLTSHAVDSAQRIVSMKFDLGSTGDAKVDFGLNQIYSTPVGDFGVSGA